jgi:ring-1,2-phenylacetyl-CoA epoxidase subunit PaaD
VVKTTTITESIWAALDSVMDPEIPVVSIVDMGMVEQVEVQEGRARVVILPTFSGCPAISIIKRETAEATEQVKGVESVVVDTTYSPPWTTDRITETGRAKLREFGLAPPTGTAPVLITQIGLPKVAECPFCGSTNTRNDSPFGPTPCRALYYCEDCRNPFEQFKPI